MSEPQAAHTLDACRLLCPMPVIRTQNKVAELTPGDTLTVLATDPGVRHDIPAWCRVHGHKFLDATEATDSNGITVITLTLQVC